MRYLEDIKDMLCRELEEISRRGEIGTAKDLDAIDKLTHSLKSVETIMAMGNYSYGEESYGNSYARGRQRRNAMGRYMSYDDGYSSRRYDPYYGGGYSRRDGDYSRADAKEHMMEQLREAMQTASSDETKEAIKKALQMMEKEG